MRTMNFSTRILRCLSIAAFFLAFTLGAAAQGRDKNPPPPPPKMFGDQYHAYVARPGQLREAIPSEIARSVRRLSIRGMLNSDDIRNLESILNRSSCVNERGRSVDNYIELDLSDVEFAQSVSYKRDVIPNGFLDYARHLRGIRLPRHTREIGNRAFSHCRDLEYVEMPRYVVHIGEETFYECERLTEISFPEGLQEIGKECFYKCRSLEYVQLPSTLAIIGDQAFAFCPLTSLQLPSGLRSLGYNSLDGTQLREIYIPRDTHIERNMPGNNKQLERIVVERGNREYSSENGILYDYNGTVLLQTPCAYRGQLSLPEGVEEIAPFSCMYSNISSVNLPSSLRRIGKSAFQACPNLTSISIPHQVSVIEPYTFADCASLGHVSLGDNVRSIGQDAFRGCKTLHDLIIPQNVVQLGKEVFKECYGLREIIIPEGVTSLPVGCFRNCNGLLSVNLPSRLISIDDEAFRGCQILPSVVIPQGVTTIGDEVFRSCDEIQEIVIPSSVTTIGKKPFTKCPKLVRIVCESNYPPMLKSTDSKDVVLIVPQGTAKLYKKASGWKKHKTIQENNR